MISVNVAASSLCLRVGDAATARGREVWCGAALSRSACFRHEACKEALTVKVAEVQSSCVVLQGHGDDITGLAFSPDSAIIVSSSRDCSLRVWQVSTGIAYSALSQSGNAVHTLLWPALQALAVPGLLSLLSHA